VGNDCLLASWDIENKTHVQIFRGEKPSDFLVISPNGKFLANGDLYGSVTIYNPEDLKVAGKDATALKEFENESDEPRTVTALKFSPDSNLLIAAYENDGNTSLEMFTLEPLEKSKKSI